MKRGLGIAFVTLAIVGGACVAWWSSTRAPSSDSTADRAADSGSEAPSSAPPPTLASPRIERRVRDEPVEVVDRRIRGQVRDGDERPIPGAVVRELGVPSPAATTTTDEDGRFVLLPKVTRSAGLIVSATGFGDAVLGAYAVRPELKIQLETGWVISGTVRDSVSQRRLVAVPVRAWPTRETPGPTSSASWKATWSADGTFRVTVPAAGTYTLDVGFIGFGDDASTYDEWIPMRVEDVEAGARDLRVSVVRGRTIEGEIVDESGARVTGHLWLSVRGPRETRDSGLWLGKGLDVEAGEFRVPGLSPGHYELSVRPARRDDDGSQFCPATVKNVEAGARGVVVRLERGVMLHGRLVDDAGAIVAGAGLVYARREDDPRTSEQVGGELEAGGRFRVGPLAEGHLFELTARRFAGYVEGSVAGVSPHAADVVVVLARAKQIRGRLVTEDGKPVADRVPVLAVCEAVAPRTAGGHGSCVTQADGTFVIDGLLNLDFTVEVGGPQSEYLAVEARNVRAGATDLVLQVAIGVRIRERSSTPGVCPSRASCSEPTTGTPASHRAHRRS